MRLNVYLKQRGVITGPLSSKSNTSHSSLDVTLKYLTNREQFKGGEGFLTFGSATHERCLVGISTTYLKLNSFERAVVKAIEQKFNSHPVVKKLMLQAICEVKRQTFLNGVRISYILDIHQPPRKRGADLKTTACKTLKEFIQSAVDYGYFRQGETYKAAEGLRDFIFIGVQKVPPFEIFILDVSLYPQETKYAIQELEFLLYFFQNYGKAERGGVDLRSNKWIEEAGVIPEEAWKAISSATKVVNKVKTLHKKFKKLKGAKR